jgi:hypothetical protein
MSTSIHHDISSVPRWRALARRLHPTGTARLPRSAVAGLAALSLGLLAWAAPAAQAAQRPAGAQVAPAILYKYTFSRIAWTGADAVIAATDSHGDLYYFWQASGTTTWHKQLVAKGTSRVAYAQPSIAWTGQEVFIAAVNSVGSLVYFSRQGGATTWSYELLASSSAKFQAPSVTAGGGTVVISAGSTYGEGELEAFTLAAGSSTWTVQTLAFGTFGPSSATTVVGNSHVRDLGLITAVSSSNLYFWWADLGSNSWTEETIAAAGAGGGYTGGSVAASADSVLVTAATTTGAVDSFTQPLGSSGWTQQAVATSGGPYPSPQIAWTGPVDGTSNSFDVITAASKAGALDFWWVQDGTTNAWAPETVAANGLQAVYANPGISVTSTATVITAINTKPGNVMYWQQAFNTNPWTKEVVAKG